MAEGGGPAAIADGAAPQRLSVAAHAAQRHLAHATTDEQEKAALAITLHNKDGNAIQVVEVGEKKVAQWVDESGEHQAIDVALLPPAKAAQLLKKEPSAMDLAKDLFWCCLCPHMVDDPVIPYDHDEEKQRKERIHRMVEGKGGDMKEQLEAEARALDVGKLDGGTLEIALYPFDGLQQVPDWPQGVVRDDELPCGPAGQRQPLSLEPRQLVSVEPSKVAEQRGWKYGSKVVAGGLVTHGFWPAQYTAPVMRFLQKQAQIREDIDAVKKAGGGVHNLLVALYEFDTSNVPEDRRSEMMPILPGTLVEAVQKASGWVQARRRRQVGPLIDPATDAPAHLVTGWVPENVLLPVDQYLEMMFEFEACVQSIIHATQNAPEQTMM